MSEPYVGEIRMVGFNFAPSGWALCDGSVLQINDNEVLFDLIGTTYGGDGLTTFALPNLLGRRAVHKTSVDNTAVLGQVGGAETVTLTTEQLPSHFHYPIASSRPGTRNSPKNAYWAAAGGAVRQYAAPLGDVLMSPNAIQPAGGGQPHENMPPFLAINFIISLFGVFPSQN